MSAYFGSRDTSYAGIKNPVYCILPSLEYEFLYGRTLYDSGLLNILVNPARFGEESPPVPPPILVPTFLPSTSTRAFPCIHAFISCGADPASSNINRSHLSPLTLLGLSAIIPSISERRPNSILSGVNKEARFLYILSIFCLFRFIPPPVFMFNQFNCIQHLESVGIKWSLESAV